MKRYCVIVWRWPADKTLESAYVEEVIGPFENRRGAVSAANARKKGEFRMATVFILHEAEAQ